MNHPGPNLLVFQPATPYQGLLGSESNRFDIHDQRTTDIHYTNYYPVDAQPKLRQRTAAFAQGLSFASAEWRQNFVMGIVNGIQWPVNETWVAADYYAGWTDFYNRGPSQPGPFGPWPVPGLPEPVVMAWTGGQWRAGHFVRWFHETVEWRYEPGPAGHLIPAPLFYHEHQRRGQHEHHVDLPMVPNGKHCQFDDLHFGTQLQIYRRAMLEDL